MAAWLIPIGVGASKIATGINKHQNIRYLVKWLTPTGKTATKSVVSKEAGIKALEKKGFKPSDIKIETGKGARAKGSKPKRSRVSGRWEQFRKHGSQVEGEEGGTLNKYKKDEIKRLKEQIAIQEKAAGPGSERELKSLYTRLNKMQPSIPIPKKKPPRVTSQSSNKSEYFYDEHGKPTFLTGHGYNMLKTKRKPKQTKKTGGKVISKRHGGMSHVGLYPAEERGEDISRSTGTLSQAKRKRHMNKGGQVGDKKQGYKARKDESIAQRVKKKRTKKQLVASRDESYGKWGKGKGKGKINHADGNKFVASLYD